MEGMGRLSHRVQRSQTTGGKKKHVEGALSRHHHTIHQSEQVDTVKRAPPKQNWKEASLSSIKTLVKRDVANKKREERLLGQH